MKMHLADTYVSPFWWKSSLQLFVIVYVAIFILLYMLLSQNCYQKKCIIPCYRNISVTMKSRVSAVNIGIKVSVLPRS